MSFKFCLSTILAAALSFGAAPAYAGQYASEYSISMLGFNVGKSSFKTTINKNNYKISGSLRASGIAKIFTSVDGTITASGKHSASKITPSAFDVRYKEGKKAKRTKIGFSIKGVKSVSNSPKVRKKGAWVDVKSGHLNGVLDPISAILVPAKSLRSVCSQTLKIYDGAMRVNLPMKYVRTIPFSTKGYKGDAVTCRALFRPVSGYDKKKKDIVWMRDKGYLDISFAPVGKTGLYAPVKAKIKLRVGTANIRAKRFQVVSN